MYTPSKTKFKKYQKGKSFNRIKINKMQLKCGQIGLRSLVSSRVTTKQLMMLYKNIKKKMKKKGRVVISVFPQAPITKKPTEVRMGKGKGSFSFFVARVSAGCTICEVLTPNKVLAIKVLKNVRSKLPLKTRIFFRSK